MGRFLDDAVALVGADGAPLLQGRSLVYRFAAAAPLWVGAATGATDLDPGLIRRACSGMLGHFASHGVVLGLWMVDDDRRRRLFGNELKGLGQRHA